MTLLDKLRHRARQIKANTMVVFFAARDPQTPWYAKLTAGIVLSYAFSPIDLVPDFIPVLGLLDDLLIVPLGLALAIKMIPDHVLESAKVKAQQTSLRPTNIWAAAVIIIIWACLAALVIKLIFFN